MIASHVNHKGTAPSGKNKPKIEIPTKFVMAAAQVPNAQTRMAVGKTEACRQLAQLPV
ncbi:MAG: hypothetical protein PHD76_00735 [Methylacidiphilales bacterium]|nr:hypothetical protein [Candidatus Methylacidiphilales bacterium]